mmetsp:Transcript_34549/g.83587  ORF Transcript_34549/g.83587 Transcript_34549/m.83587 type:complete len:223 (+) Transcript_34549:2998-3666(+)
MFWYSSGVMGTGVGMLICPIGVAPGVIPGVLAAWFAIFGVSSHLDFLTPGVAPPGVVPNPPAGVPEGVWDGVASQRLFFFPEGVTPPAGVRAGVESQRLEVPVDGVRPGVASHRFAVPEGVRAGVESQRDEPPAGVLPGVASQRFWVPVDGVLPGVASQRFFAEGVRAGVASHRPAELVDGVRPGVASHLLPTAGVSAAGLAGVASSSHRDFFGPAGVASAP